MTSTEEVIFDSATMAQLREVLNSSNAILPESARQLHGWQVGFLDRFESID
jgi:hypothetical protein